MIEAAGLPGLHMTGLFQHFSVADEAGADSVAYTAAQHALFVRAFEALRAAGQEPALVHCDKLSRHPAPPGLARRPAPGALHGPPRHHPVRLSPQPRRAMPRSAAGHGHENGGQHGQGAAARPVGQLRAALHRQSPHPGRHPLRRLRRRLSPPAQRGERRRGHPRRPLPGAGPGLHGPDAGGRHRPCRRPPRGTPPSCGAAAPPGDTAESIALKTGTISYEVLCGVARRVPRVYLEQGQAVAVDDHLTR